MPKILKSHDSMQAHVRSTTIDVARSFMAKDPKIASEIVHFATSSRRRNITQLRGETTLLTQTSVNFDHNPKKDHGSQTFYSNNATNLGA
jgi:hypothetical protein